MMQANRVLTKWHELARHGVTSFCPTSMTLSHEKLMKICRTISSYKSEGSKIAGINLEGPFIAMSKKGAQNGDYVREGTVKEFDELWHGRRQNKADNHCTGSI